MKRHFVELVSDKQLLDGLVYSSNISWSCVHLSTIAKILNQ